MWHNLKSRFSILICIWVTYNDVVNCMPIAHKSDSFSSTMNADTDSTDIKQKSKTSVVVDFKGDTKFSLDDNVDFNEV